MTAACPDCGRPPVPPGEPWDGDTHCPRSAPIPSCLPIDGAAAFWAADAHECLRLGMARLRAENVALVGRAEKAESELDRLMFGGE